MRDRRVVPFDRTRRARSYWSLGDPPGRRRRAASSGRGRPARWVAAATAAVLLGPPAVDAGSALWREDRDCVPLVVVDGDTIRAWCPGSIRLEAIRLMGFDTPEFASRCPQELAGAVAATFVLRWHLWTASESLTVRRGQDRYGRTLAALVLDEEPVFRTMITAGVARPYDGGRREGWCT